MKFKAFLAFLIFLGSLLSPGISFSSEVSYLPGRFPQLFENEEILAGNSSLSDPIYIGDAQGNFSIQYNLSGPGDLKIEYLLSLNGSDFLEPSAVSDISANATNSTSPDIVSFTPPLAEFIKIQVTETSSSANVTSFNLWLGRQ